MKNVAIGLLLLGALAAVVWFARRPPRDVEPPAVALLQPPPAQESTRDCPSCPELLRVPAGSFAMGSPASEPHRNSNEGPQRKIVFAKPFLLGKFEITRREFLYFADSTKYLRPPDPQVPDKPTDTWRQPGFNQWGEHPVVNVTYEDAEAYVAWLTRTTGHAYRIPTEAEWEYAARAGTTTPYHWSGDERDACAHANVADIAFHVWSKEGPPIDIAPCNDRFPHTATVGSYKPNAWGFHDMIGNALEWTSTCWTDTLGGAGGDCNRRALRGGSWLTPILDDRIASRTDARVGYTEFNIGFRVARDE